jgi:hypothetical protein
MNNTWIGYYDYRLEVSRTIPRQSLDKYWTNNGQSLVNTWSMLVKVVENNGFVDKMYSNWTKHHV